MASGAASALPVSAATAFDLPGLPALGEPFGEAEGDFLLRPGEPPVDSLLILLIMPCMIAALL
jgi:hypothetical protein